MVKNKIWKREIMEGSAAIAETIKMLEPGVIASYPITPQTHIMEELAKLAADGDLNSKYIPADSEFSAASIALGASATGVRSYTASSSQGLLLMTEVVYNMAGTRLPVLFTAVNRSLSPPINIQVDHQDTMTFRDFGIIQIYVESIQEAIDSHIQILKVAEHKKVLLPAMVCMDGWILSHAYEPVTLWQPEAVKEFVPPFKPAYKLDPDFPLTYGGIGDVTNVMEFKYMVHEALNYSKSIIKKTAEDFYNFFGNYHGGLVEEVKTDDADMVFVAMGSITGTIKVAIEKMRAKGWKVGLVKVRVHRPFPKEELKSILKDKKLAIVLDKGFSCSLGGILGQELKACLNTDDNPEVFNYIVGLGGRELFPETIENIASDANTRLEETFYKDDRVIFWELNHDLLNEIERGEFR